MKSRLLRHLTAGAVGLLSALAVGLVLEAGLRIAGYEYNTLMKKRFVGEKGVPDNRKAGHFTQVFEVWSEFEYDPVFFWLPKPGQSVFNEQGTRGPVWGPKQEGGPLRVVTIGNSNTLGFIIGHENHWPGFTQVHFDELELQVVNAGVYGYSAYQGLLRFRSLLSLEPDLVTISFGTNDAHHRGFDDQQLAERISLFDALASWKLGDLLLQVYDTVSPLPDYDNRRPRVPLDRYRQHLEAMIELCEARGIECLLLTHPFDDTDPYAKRAMSVDPLFFLRFVDQYNAVTRAVAAETGARLLDVAPVFEGKSRLFTDSSHLSPFGQRIMADLLAGKIKEIFPELRRTQRALNLTVDSAAFDGMHLASDVPHWSKGQLQVDLSNLTLQPDDTRIFLETRGWRRFASPEDVGLKVFLDGTELDFLEKKGWQIHYALPAGLRTAGQLTITINPFTPIVNQSEEDQAGKDQAEEDSRALGLDILSVGLGT